MKNTQLTEYSVPQGVKATKTALIIPKGLTREEWLELGQFLRSSEDSLVLWQADWRKHGYDNYDKDFVDQAVDQMQFRLHGVETLKLHGEILPEYRHPELTPEHYLVVAKRVSDPSQHKVWLDTAKIEELSARELQASIRANEVIRINMDERRVSLPSPYAARAEYFAWRKELGDAWESWTAKDCRDVSQTLRETWQEMAKFDATLTAKANAIEGRADAGIE